MILFPDLNLARRLEFHEAWSCEAHARTQAQLYPATAAISQPVAEGRMVYCGRKSPLSRVDGWGLSGAVSAAELEAVEAFYQSRGLRPRVDVCSLADASLLALLSKRHYLLQSQMNVYARPIDPQDGAGILPSGVEVRTASLEEARLWFSLNGSDGDWAEPDGMAFMLIRSLLKPDTRLFLAWLDGQPVSGGALETHNGVAALMAADTLPAFRQRGLHTALLRARLAAAANAGCDLALMHARPGADSQRNALRAGFQLVYVVDTLVKSSD